MLQHVVGDDFIEPVMRDFHLAESPGGKGLRWRQEFSDVGDNVRRPLAADVDIEILRAEILAAAEIDAGGRVCHPAIIAGHGQRWQVSYARPGENRLPEASLKWVVKGQVLLFILHYRLPAAVDGESQHNEVADDRNHAVKNEQRIMQL